MRSLSCARAAFIKKFSLQGGSSNIPLLKYPYSLGYYMRRSGVQSNNYYLLNCNQRQQQREFFFKNSGSSVVPKDDSGKSQNEDRFTTSFYVKALAPIIAALVYWYLKNWENKKVKVDFDALKKYLETYQDQIREQAFLAGLESLSHEEHRELMNEVISQCSEAGKYLVDVSNAEKRNLFDLDIQVMSAMKTYKPHTFVDGHVKYALFGELWYMEEKNPTTLQAYGKKCFDSRDITLNIHCPVKILAKPVNGAVLGQLGDKPLCYLVVNVQMKSIEKDFIPTKRPELTISKISIAPITSHFSTITGLKEQRLFEEIEVEKALAPNSIHHAADGLHSQSFSWKFFN